MNNCIDDEIVGLPKDATQPQLMEGEKGLFATQVEIIS